MQVYEQRLKRDQLLHTMAKKKEQRRVKEAYTENTGQPYPEWAIQEKPTPVYKVATTIPITKEIMDDKVSFYNPDHYEALAEWVNLLENKYKELFEKESFYSTLSIVS